MFCLLFLALRNAANLTPPTSCRRLACSTHIILAFSPLHGYYVVYGMFLSRRLSLTSRFNTSTVLCRSPRYALTSKGPLSYMAEPSGLLISFYSYFHPLDAFLELAFKFFKWSNRLQNFNVCPHRCDILLHLALYFNVSQDSCMSSWIGHTPLIPKLRGCMSSQPH